MKHVSSQLHDQHWQEDRLRAVDIRSELTDEWQKRGVTDPKDFKILTDQIVKSTFGMRPSKFKRKKGLKNQSLRDHMTEFELLLTMLGEHTTAELHRQHDSRGLVQLKADAKIGGRVARSARRQLEKNLGTSIITEHNFLKPKKA